MDYRSKVRLLGYRPHLLVANKLVLFDSKQCSQARRECTTTNFPYPRYENRKKNRFHRPIQTPWRSVVRNPYHSKSDAQKNKK